jgi:trehalose/maltose hydrolase-like predicted phosphorylase
MSTADLGRTVEYYLARTAHGSTLSRVVHASVLARTDLTRAWTVFREALMADLDDTQGGTTREGIHLGAMAGTADLVVRSFAGLQIDDDGLTFTPRLPPRLRSVGFRVVYRGQRIDVSVTAETLHLQLQPCRADPVRIRLHGTVMEVGGGQTVDFSLHPPDSHDTETMNKPMGGQP